MLTHIISILKNFIHARIHIMVIQGHEGSVDHDTQGDEQVNEGVEHDEWEELCQLDVAVTAVPHTHHLETLNTKLVDFFF